MTTSAKRAPSVGATQQTSGNSSNGAPIETGIMTFPPIVHIAVGGILLASNIVGNMLQVQSTQSWFLHIAGGPKFDATIWQQWPMFFQGQLSPTMNVAFIAGWGAQVILLVSKIGTGFIQARALEKHGTSAHKVISVVKEAGIRVGVWNFLAWGIILVDSLTDWGYSNGMGFFQQCFFIAVTFLLTFFCGTWGIMNIVSGFGRMRE